MRFLTLAFGLLTAASPAFAQTGPDVYQYHADARHSGSYVVPGLAWASAPQMHRVASFKGTVVGNSLAQPLYWRAPGATNGMIIVASNSGWVQALNSITGLPIWKTQVSPAFPNFVVPCAGGSSYGVNGTPVIDDVSGTMYFDTLTLENNIQQHELYALSLMNGAVIPGWPINVQQALALKGYTFTPSNQDQHGALALVNGTIYVAYGGMGGDCGIYHGWVLALPEAQQPPLGQQSLAGVWATSGQWGGIWGLGGVVYDGTSLFVATGNTIKGTKTWGDGEAIIRVPFDLSHSALPADNFAPKNWIALDKADVDVGSSAPLLIDVPVAGGGTVPLLFAINKGGNGYLLDRTNLGGVGGQLLSQQLTSNEVITAPAAIPSPDGEFVAFRGNGIKCPVPGANTLTVVDVTYNPANTPAAAINTAWCAAINGQGTPITTTSDGFNDPMVWVTGAQGDNQLYGFNATTGEMLFPGTASTQMSTLRRLTTILAAEGRLYVTGKNVLYAFSPDPNQQ